MKYEPALDGLRAVAVLLVVLFHAFPDRLPGGWMGVDIFFVLSGYLITTVLVLELRSSGNISFLNFYKRRSLRLIPASACVFGFQIVRAFLSQHYRREIIYATLAGAFYFMNWNRAFDLFPQDILGHMWSLSMEEQFYLVWPAILSVIFLRNPRSWIIVLIVAVITWRAFVIFRGGSVERTYNGFDTHSDALLIGCLLSFLSDTARYWLGRARWISLAFFGIAFFAAPYDAPGMQLIGLTVVSIFAASMITGASTCNRFAGMLSLPPLLFTGRISYGWYLWHYPVLMIGRFHGLVGVVSGLALITLSFCIATVSFFIVEKPFLRLKARL